MATEPISSLDRVEAIIRNTALYELAKLVPQQVEGEGGRPRQFPDYMLLLFDALISVYGSSRKVEAELSHRHTWKFVRRLVKKMHPNDPTMWLPAQRYKRHHYSYGRNRYLTNPVVLAKLQALHRELAVDQANELGLLDPEGDGSFTHPSLDRMFYADGKVVTPLYRAKPGDTKVNKETGEIINLRYEADAALHMEGTGEMAWGTKFVITAVRSTDRHGRMILDARHSPNVGGEAKTAMEVIGDLAGVAKGAQGVIYDGALRGVHHAELMSKYGLLSINKVQAKEVATRNGKPVKRVEKNVHVEDKVVDGKTVRLFAKGGAIGVVELDDKGEQHFVELKRVKTTRRDDKNGKYRFYNLYALPEGGTVMVRLDTTDEDRERKLNRSENVRAIAPGDADFKRLYARRADAESINRGLEDSMFLGRAHSKGAARQSVNLLGFALMVNSLALYLHARDEQHDPEGNLASAA
jgi:hypothetical protein